VQLGKLRADMHRIRALGAEVLAISNDGPEDAGRLATELGLDFPVLSNPSMDVIYRYRMKGDRMPMADMGYVLIDATGRIRQHRIDRRFGEHVGDLVQSLQRIANERGAT
jgi:peroxiredoxin Q/BCP